jgi:hypothetical protein
MKRSIAMSLCAGLAFVLMAAPVSAQTNTPLADRARRTMGAEVVVVQRVQGRFGWWRRTGYRQITLYSDGVRFYRRPFGQTVLRKVVVYQRGNTFYINDEQWRWHRDYRDRYNREYRNGHDDGDDHDDHDDHGNGRGHDNGNHYGWDHHDH